jgi:hypothetical protein
MPWAIMDEKGNSIQTPMDQDLHEHDSSNATNVKGLDVS